MKITGLLLSAATLLSCALQLNAQSLEDRLIHGYSFEGHVNSSVSSEGTLTTSGTIFTTDRFGFENSAIEINNKTDGIDMPTIDDDTVSVSLWYYYQESGSFWNTLLYAPQSHHHLLIGFDQDTDGEIGYYDAGFYTTGVKLVEKTWNHIALVMAGSSYTLYLNGENIGHTDSFFGNGNWPMTFLGNFDIEGGSQGSLGKLDDVCFFRGMFTQAEIDALGQIRKECDPAPESLLLNLEFNGNSTDASANENHATLNGVTYTTDRHGLENSAALIDDKSDAITLTTPITAEDLTISCWFRYDGTGDSRSTLFGGPDDQRHMTINHQGGSVNQVGSYNSGFTSSSVSFVNGEWYHLFAEMDGSALTTSYFIDGRRMASITLTSFNNANSPLSVIGNNAINGTEGAIGAIDEIKIYNRLLTLDELAVVNCGEDVINSIKGFINPKQKLIDISPNPTSGTVRVTGKHRTVQIVDISGQLIPNIDFYSNTEFTTVDATNLPNGVYFINTENGHSKFVKY